MSGLMGYPRADGRKGIRNRVLVAYLVECAHFVAREISAPAGDAAHVVGFAGCFPNDYAQRMMQRLATHPNVGAVLLVSLGCESFNRFALEQAVAASGRPVETLVIQRAGGTRTTIQQGRDWVAAQAAALAGAHRVPMQVSELTVGTICGGSDGTSGITGNPAAGRAFDRLVQVGATCIFEETGELIGCEDIMAARAATPELADELRAAITKAARYYATLGYGSFAAGNATGGLTTIEEKSTGAYAKSGASPISGLIKPGEIPPTGGLYLMDVVPDGEVRFGFPNISDNAEIVEMMASGAHLTLFVTGRGSVVGSAIAPVTRSPPTPRCITARVIATDIDAGALESLAAEGLETRLLDVRDTAAIAQAAGAVGALDVLFNCAGFVAEGTILDCDHNDWEFSLSLNVTATYRMIRAFCQRCWNRAQAQSSTWLRWPRR